MKKINISIVVLAILAIVGCREEDASFIEETTNRVNVIELSRNIPYQGTELGIYGMEFSGLNDFTLRNKITRNRYSDGYRNQLNAYALTKESFDINEFKNVAFGSMTFEKNLDMMEPLFTKAFNARKNVSRKEIEGQIGKVMEENYGSVQNFTIGAGDYRIENEMYVPQPIEIDQIDNFDRGTNAYWIDRNNFSIKYNHDPNNKNGVALLVLWNGTTQDMSLREIADINKEYKNKIVVFNPNDTGVLNVPSHVFSRFPEYANITIVLMRGNAKRIIKGDKTNYIVTGSEQYERVILSN